MVLIRLCQINDVKEDEPVAVTVEGFPALVVYNVEGEYFVTDDHCTHGIGLLSEGFQDGNIIECPFHGGAFDIKTGAVTTFPCKVPVCTYPVQVEDGWVAITAPAP